VRSIRWSDWLYLFRHRRDLTCLDNILYLTRGNPLSLSHLLFAIHPADHLFTGVCESPAAQDRCIAQIFQSSKRSSAHLNYLLAPAEADSDCLLLLLEGLVKHAGGWGAKQVVADVDIDSPIFTQFRQAGFSVLTTQVVFLCPLPEQPIKRQPTCWRIWSSADIPAMRNLYHSVVPSLIQPGEPLTRQEALGLVYQDQKGDLQAYADLVYGPAGIWVLPIVHPLIKVDPTDLLSEMLQALPDTYGRPVYVTARSYQPWLEHALCKLSSKRCFTQALLMRYMVRRQRVKAERAYPVVENGNREPTLPIAPIRNCQD
jgi:hypothetical protein